jgi:tetratricopeptide (TPR) repeat protein
MKPKIEIFREKLRLLENKFPFMVLAGLASILAYSLQFSLSQGVSVFAVGLITAGASFLSGGFLGFLFGIPRTLQGERPEIIQNENGESFSSNNSRIVNYQANTNLEQISDWLTKILVGVGLTQIPAIRAELYNLINYLSPGLGGTSSSSAFTLALLLYFAVCGFLVGFLWTRLNLAIQLRQADEVLNRVARVEDESKHLQRQIEEQQEILDRLTQVESIQQQEKIQKEVDAKALSLVERQLNPGAPEVSQEDLDNAITAASPAIKVDIFNQVHYFRATTWRQQKYRMERSIPIFQAFASNNLEGHRSHGGLGFALKDKLEPDWEKAEKELDIAIQLRGDWQTHGITFYELSRAQCRIAQGKNTKEMNKKIWEDLAVAALDGSLTEELLDNPINVSVKDWMSQNRVNYSDFFT